MIYNALCIAFLSTSIDYWQIQTGSLNWLDDLLRDWAKGTAAPWRSWNNESCRPFFSKAQDGCLEQNRKKHASFAVSVLVRLTVSSTPLPARRRWACKKFERQTMTMHFDRARQWIVPGCSNFPDFAVLHDILLWPRLNELSTNPFARNWKHKMLLFPMPSGGPCLNNDLPQHLFLTGTNYPQCSRGLNKSQWRQLAWDSSSESCPRCSSWMLIWEMLTW